MKLLTSKGTNKSYPPEISAIKKIAVKGACKTPAIRPVMPIKMKFDSLAMALKTAQQTLMIDLKTMQKNE